MTLLGELDLSAGRFVVKRSGRIAFDSSAPAARLAPDSALDLTDQEVEFPDLWKGVFYSQFAETVDLGGVTGTVNRYACSSFAAPVGQEWGPSEAAPNTLSDIVLGAAPPGANYLDVYVNLTNTVAPAKVVCDLDIMSFLPSGQWTRLEGGSCMVESYAYLRRMFEVIIVGGNIVLRRRQSVMDTGGQIQRTTTSIADGNRQYFYPGTNAPNAPGHYAQLGAFIESKGKTTSNNYKPTGSSHCTLDASSISYRSVWSGAMKIIPGRVG